MSSERRDLDDRVHPRGQRVVDAEMALRVLAELDDVVGHGLATHERIVLVERERQGDLLLAFHVTAFPSRRLPRVNASARHIPPPGTHAWKLAGPDMAAGAVFPDTGRKCRAPLRCVRTPPLTPPAPLRRKAPVSRDARGAPGRALRGTGQGRAREGSERALRVGGRAEKDRERALRVTGRAAGAGTNAPCHGTRGAAPGRTLRVTGRAARRRDGRSVSRDARSSIRGVVGHEGAGSLFSGSCVDRACTPPPHTVQDPPDTPTTS